MGFPLPPTCFGANAQDPLRGCQSEKHQLETAPPVTFTLPLFRHRVEGPVREGDVRDFVSEGHGGRRYHGAVERIIALRASSLANRFDGKLEDVFDL